MHFLSLYLFSFLFIFFSFSFHFFLCSMKKVRRIQDVFEIELASSRDWGKVDVGMDGSEMVVQVVKQRLRVETDKLFTKKAAHAGNMAGVGPEAVVDGAKGEALLVHAQGGEEHVGGVEGVDKVGREGRLLAGQGDGLAVVLEVYLLDDGLHALGAGPAVVLDDG